MTQAAILFDLDGTLIDSAPDLHAAVARMLARERRSALSLETVRSFIGNGVPKLVERAIQAAGLPMADHPRLVAEYLEDYNAHATDLTRPYPGVMEALDDLAERGFALGVCTNKPEAPARRILEDLGLDQYLSVIIGGDTLATKKPDPAGLHHGFAQLWAPTRLYVGDSEVDAETALTAGVVFALYTEGYRKSPIDQIPHHAAFTDFAQLPGIAESLMLDTVRV